MTKILLVGVGKMGGALLRGWSTAPDVVLSTLDPHNPDADYQSVSDIQHAYDVIVLAVKPQNMTEVAASLKPLVTDKTLILSIAAGKTIGFFESVFGQNTPIIRAMPNTPALIGKGMTVFCGNKAVTAAHHDTAMRLLSTVGRAERIDDEDLMDAVTAVSGSGPAYVFYLIETMTTAGTAAGLPPALAATLARQTVIGAAALAEQEVGTDAATLRKNVTSPGGTTEAALTVLSAETDGLSPLMTRAILAARDRGRTLGG